jgi:hypothetical protein
MEKMMIFEEKGKYSLRRDYGCTRDVLIEGAENVGAKLVYECAFPEDFEKIGNLFDYIQKCNSDEEKFDKKRLDSLLK